MIDWKPAKTHDRWLAHFHVTFFACIMGLSGLTLALQKAELHLGLVQGASLIALTLTLIAFAIVALLFCLKAIRHPQALRDEWCHPVKMAFFPAISISLLLVAKALRPVHSETAEMMWLSGVSLQAILTFAVISGWMGSRRFEPVQMTPA